MYLSFFAKKFNIFEQNHIQIYCAKTTYFAYSTWDMLLLHSWSVIYKLHPVSAKDFMYRNVFLLCIAYYEIMHNVFLDNLCIQRRSVRLSSVSFVGQNEWDFWWKINILPGNYCTSWIDIIKLSNLKVASFQKVWCVF